MAWKTRGIIWSPPNRTVRPILSKCIRVSLKETAQQISGIISPSRRRVWNAWTVTEMGNEFFLLNNYIMIIIGDNFTYVTLRDTRDIRDMRVWTRISYWIFYKTTAKYKYLESAQRDLQNDVKILVKYFYQVKKFK